MIQHEISMTKAKRERDIMLAKWPDVKKLNDTNTAGLTLWKKLSECIEDHYKHNIININDYKKLKDYIFEQQLSIRTTTNVVTAKSLA
jgi:hypothetical protein